MSRKKKRKPCKPERAVAAAEVLAAVWMNGSHFELEVEIDSAGVTEDADGNPWVVVRVQVPQLDVDLWADGEHMNQTAGDS